MKKIAKLSEPPLRFLPICLLLLWPVVLFAPSSRFAFPDSVSGGMFFTGVASCYEFKPKVLASLSDPLEELMVEIIECESGGDPKVCNQEFGCKAGMGLCQIIPSTLKYCEEKLGRKLDPFNPEDNLECGVWLLENEGCGHWNSLLIVIAVMSKIIRNKKGQCWLKN